MTENKRRNTRASTAVSAPQADGFSWSETQTGVSAIEPQDEPGDLAEPNGADAGAATRLDVEGAPIVTYAETPHGRRASTEHRR